MTNVELNYLSFTMKENIIRTKSFQFALEIVDIYKYLVFVRKEYVISKQLLRSGTSIGAMVRKSEYAQSKPDFIHKLSIGIKECNESLYWLELLKQSEYLNEKKFHKLWSLGSENRKILSSIILTSKETLKQIDK